MPRVMRVCPCTRCAAHEGTCPTITTGGRCAPCRTRADAARGTARQRGYDQAHETTFRLAILRRDPTCVCTDTTHGHAAPCSAPSVHADHHPHTRRELADRGQNPNDPRHGRGLCDHCHNKHTPHESPGGWHAQRH
jgi:5-methylcytosine-specific restriction protein A